MRGIAVNFQEAGGSLLPRVVSDFDATAQCCAVNIATEGGSDPAYAERGTDLLQQAVEFGVVSFTEAQHLSNFASVNTQVFMQQFDVPGQEGLAEVVISPAELNVFYLRTEAQFTSTLGRKIGIVSNLPITNG